MAEHSMCQPGRPLPQGLSHAGSPGLALFHRAKSPGDRLRSAMSPPSPCMTLRRAAAQLAVSAIFADVEVDIAVRRVGEALVDQRPCVS